MHTPFTNRAAFFVNEGTFYELEEHMPPCGMTPLPAPSRQPPPHPRGAGERLGGALRRGEVSWKPAHGLKIAHSSWREMVGVGEG